MLDFLLHNILYQRICKMMEDEKLFLKKDLKITELATRIGTNRTYVSSCINHHSGVSFSDFIHRYRIEYAMTILAKDKETSMAEVAEHQSHSWRSRIWLWGCGQIDLSFGRHGVFQTHERGLCQILQHGLSRTCRLRSERSADGCAGWNWNYRSEIIKKKKILHGF